MAVFYNRDQAIAAVTLDHRNAFSQLVYLKGAAHAEVKSTVRPAKVTLTDDPNVFYVGTCLLHVNSIRMAYHRAVSRCRELQERLLLGCPSDLDKDRIFDSPSDERTGFGLMADKDPGLDQRKKASLLRHVLSTPRHRQEFGLFDGSINGSRVRRYMADYDEYMENMVLVAHLGSGLPARSTELSTYTLINGRSSLRSIYYSGGQVMLLCSYSKVRSLLQANRTIARFLDKEASDLMIKDQLFVRPFVAFLAKKCLLDPSGRYLYHLWVRDGQVMSCDALRKVFVRLTTLYSNCPSPLQFGDYRHLAKHISNLLSLPAQYREAMKEYEDEGDEEADDGDAGNGDGDQEEGVIPAAAEHLAMARQMGHSLSTGVRVYGRTNEAHKHLAGHSIHMFRVISSAWHQFISVPEAAGPRSVAHTLPGNRECIGIPRLSPLDVEGISARSEPPIAVRSLTVATPSTLFALVSGKAALSSDWAPPLRILRSGPEGRRLAMEPYTESVDDVTFLQPAEDTTRNLVYNCNFFPNESNEELDLLKKLYGPDASFKSEAQSIAADYIVQGNSNVFIVLPTGGGNSALIFLLAVKEPHLTSLVVVPTVSLAQDLAQRARSLGISAAVGLHCYDEQERHSILIVTPEAVCFQENLEKLMLLKLRGLLFKIVIDEAHVLFNDASWRRSLQRLPTIGCLGLPMILLSGSCPPEETSLIIEAFFTEPSRPIMIRDGTNRPNISYQVETVSDDAEFFHCLKLILENFFENSNAESLMIVFVTQRSHVEILMQRLFESGFSCQGYHGGMNSRERETAFNSWNPSQDRVMVATSAFGMGIDRPCVRLVVMYGQPYSLLEYAQQSGRAGRDGKGSNAVLFYSVDSVLARINRTSDPVELRNYQLMNFFATARVCRRRIISQYLDDKETSCRKNPENILCDNCGPQSTIMASILGRSLKTNSVAMPVSVASSGSVVVGAELIRNDRDICRKLPDLLEKLGNCCGLHLSDNPAQPPRFCGQHCSLVTGKCNFCLCAGHYVDKCSLKKSMKIISSELFCFNCFRPVLRNVHSGDFTNCRLPKTMKDFFFWRVNTMGYDSKNIDVTKLCHDFIRAAETSLASRHSTGSTASRLTAATASTPSAPPASTANAATASSVNTHTSEFTRISAQSQVEDVKKEKLSEKFSELERCLDIFRHKCIICTFEESSTNNHVTSSCPRIKRLCIRCLGSHTSKECELKVPNYCCSRCLLPKAEHAKYGHGPNCKYDFNDLLKYFGCMFARQGRKTEAAVCEYMNTTKDGVHVVYKAFIEFVSSLK
jgi:superfamily II DNA helicase RecQ